MYDFFRWIQILEIIEEFDYVITEQYEIHHQFIISTLPVHLDFRFAGDAAVRWTVSTKKNQQ